ncbi:MAG: DUF4148 domain-containing protein [Clostridia bacterium]|nr:DUF4148 domain-containing protein [Clostridia bacterium]
MKKTLTLCMVMLCALLLLTGGASGDLSAQKDDAPKTDAEARARYQELRKVKERATRAGRYLEESWYPEGEYTPIYPDHYGGSYIKGDQLCICVVNPSEEILQEYRERMRDHLDVIVFQEVPYSYQTMVDAQHSIFLQLMNEGLDVVSVGYGDSRLFDRLYFYVQEESVSKWDQSDAGKLAKQGTIQIEKKYPVPITIEVLAPREEEQESEQRMPPGELRTGEEGEKTMVTMAGGAYLQNWANMKWATLGLCGTYQGETAVLSCGHFCSSTGEILRFYPGYHQLGGVSYRQVGNGDFSITKYTNPSLYRSNYVGWPIDTEGQRITTWASRPNVDDYVECFGAEGGYAYGTVVNNNTPYAITIDGVTTIVSGGVRVELVYGQLEDGDSGGPVYDGHEFLGVINGRGANETTGSSGLHELYFTPCQPIIAAGFTPYTGS